jgi:aryl-alcohol dehydrogenase-like predicted oxidoreductase
VKLETINLADDLKICRILNGMWQVSGTHGQIDKQMAIKSMIEYHNNGFTTWDLADIYGPAESFIGEFRKKINSEQIANTQALTKFVPNPGPMSKSIVEHYIDQSLQKMNTDTLDLVQFHWWDYNDLSYMDAIEHLFSLKEKQKIKHVGLTNFDTERVKIMTEKGFTPITNQVQYSILDQRAEKLMVPFCQKHEIKILAYGTLLGGFFSEKYLKADEPTRADLDTASLQKYYNMIQEWGGWELFQELLATIDTISKKHNCSIANVATKFILDRPTVGGVIIGARLGISEHIEDNSKAFDVKLDSDDLSSISSITTKANNLFEIIGDCGGEYR